MATCYAITDGEYSDYRVLAVFSTKKLAERELPKYGKNAEIEEFPFNSEIPNPPSGMTGFVCDEGDDGEVWAFDRSASEMAGYENIGEVRRTFGVAGRYRVTLWARNKDHAIKIAAEKFARQKAIDAGIAC